MTAYLTGFLLGSLIAGIALYAGSRWTLRAWKNTDDDTA